MNSIKDVIRERRSVRTFDAKELSTELIDSLQQYLNQIQNPYQIPITFSIKNAKEYSLSSPVLVGEKWYVLGKVERVMHAEEAYGYALEDFILYAHSLGLGTVWIGGTMNRTPFYKAMDLQENEFMPCITPIGYPAKKMSFRETMMRKGVKADQRKKNEELFFENDFQTPLVGDGVVSDLLEAVRLAPSAVNKQPWRILKINNAYHFYICHSLEKTKEAGDMQLVDMGIALKHFELVLQEEKIPFHFECQSATPLSQEGYEYVASYFLEKE